MKWKKILDILPNKKTKLTAMFMAVVNGLSLAGVNIPEEIVRAVNDIGIPALAFFIWLKIDREEEPPKHMLSPERSW